MTARPAILFICLGNICRSPLAEGAMRDAARRRGLDLHIDSAGTGRWHVGHPPDRRAMAEAERHGVDISRQRARQLRVEDFEDFDEIVVLDANNLKDVRAMMSPNTLQGSKARLSLLLDNLSGRYGESVADPYYGPDEGFARAWEDIHQACEAMLDRLDCKRPDI